MSEVTSTQAGNIIGVSHMTIWRHINAGLLPARKEGLRQDARIALDDLRKHADQYGYRFNDELAAAYTEPGK